MDTHLLKIIKFVALHPATQTISIVVLLVLGMKKMAMTMAHGLTDGTQEQLATAV